MTTTVISSEEKVGFKSATFWRFFFMHLRENFIVFLFYSNGRGNEANSVQILMKRH